MVTHSTLKSFAERIVFVGSLSATHNVLFKTPAAMPPPDSQRPLASSTCRSFGVAPYPSILRGSILNSASRDHEEFTALRNCNKITDKNKVHTTHHTLKWE